MQTGVPTSGLASGVSLGLAWIPAQLLSLGSLDLACGPEKLKSSEAGLGFLDLAWLLVKQKLSSEVIDQNVESEEGAAGTGGAVWGCWVDLKRFNGWQAMSYLGFLGPT